MCSNRYSCRSLTARAGIPVPVPGAAHPIAGFEQGDGKSSLSRNECSMYMPENPAPMTTASKSALAWELLRICHVHLVVTLPQPCFVRSKLKRIRRRQSRLGTWRRQYGPRR